MTHLAGRRPAVVATASPTSMGPCCTASRSISSPPARLIAPATPAPIHKWLFAAFAIASTLSEVMSPSLTSNSAKERLEADGQPGRKRRKLLQGEQHARHVGLARVGIVADREQLPFPAKQHFLVGDESGQPHGMDL